MVLIKVHPVILIPILFLLAACSPPDQEQPQTQITDTTPLTPAGDVKYIMQWVLDPAADHIWDSAGSIITATGTRELAPTTDEGWLAVQHSAAVVAESGNLLIMPGRARDDGAWRDISLGLVAAGQSAQAAAEAHDTDALFDAGGQIYRVCTSCHAAYIHDDEDGDPAYPD